MISTKGVKADDRKVSKYVTYGVQQLTINSIEPKAASTGSIRAIFNVESPTVTEAGFEADPAAVNGGKVGRVATIYMKTPQQIEDFTKVIAIIAEKLGVRDQIDAVSADNIIDYINKVSPILSGKPAFFAVTAEEYAKQDGKIGYSLHFRRYGFVASMTEGIKHLKPFDKNNKYDYKALAIADVEAIANTGVDDLPF